MKALRNGMLTIAALALARMFAGPASAQAKAGGSLLAAVLMGFLYDRA